MFTREDIKITAVHFQTVKFPHSTGLCKTERTPVPQTKWAEKQKNIQSKRPWSNVLIPTGHVSKLGRYPKKPSVSHYESEVLEQVRHILQYIRSLWLSNLKTRHAKKWSGAWIRFWTEQTKQVLTQGMAQHGRDTPSGQDSVVYLHLKASNHSFREEHVCILDRQEHKFEQEVEEAVYMKRGRPSLHQRGGLRVHISPSYNQN